MAAHNEEVTATSVTKGEGPHAYDFRQPFSPSLSCALFYFIVFNQGQVLNITFCLRKIFYTLSELQGAYIMLKLKEVYQVQAYQEKIGVCRFFHKNYRGRQQNAINLLWHQLVFQLF